MPDRLATVARGFMFARTIASTCPTMLLHCRNLSRKAERSRVPLAVARTLAPRQRDLARGVAPTGFQSELNLRSRPRAFVRPTPYGWMIAKR
jgi:hypothetical protein